MSKFAYCIIAHNEPYIFRKLVSQIDDEQNSIYVMIDKKSDLALFNNIKLKYSSIKFCPRRIDIRWGDISQIVAELELFKFARNNGDHLYYHLISGQDLLIKPVKELNKFVLDNQDHEFLGFRDYSDGRKTVEFRMKYYHIFPHLLRSNNPLIKIFYRIFIKLQQIIGINRRFPERLQMGANWGSLSLKFIDLLLANEKRILKEFKYTLCCDELYKQFIAVENGLYEKCDELTTKGPDKLRLIDWDMGRPYTWKLEKLEYILNSNKFIARKFNSSDKELIQTIINQTICNEQTEMQR